ncbi:hypothetical protein, partial [Lysinibacillus sp. NPDC093688]|uniref:hypothetical protein n=1 Tax=Lysinibacillus sp. NPDC093688 TaxID=3390577 RepID=UPI003D07B3E4
MKNIEQSMIYKNNTFRDFDNLKTSLQSPAMDSFYQSNKAIASSLSALDLSDTLSAVSKIGSSLSPAMDSLYQSNKAIASSLSALDLSDTLSAVSKIGSSLSP